MLNRKPLPRVSPSEVGLRADVLEEILDGLAARGEMHSLMIARHGKVCLEAFWAPYGPQIRHCLWSQTKSYTATAIGCLVDEGRLSLDEKVAELLAPYMPPEPCDNLRRMTVRDLLCMATGQRGPQNRTTPEWVKEFFSGTFTDTGKVFGYSGVVSSLLGVVLRAKTGMGLMEYMTPRVFDKIGIDAATIKWMEHPDGQEYGGGGLITKTEDNLRLGLLYCGGGVFDGQRVLSSQWVQEATRKQIETTNDPDSDGGVGYGYQIWPCRRKGAYRFDGAGGQLVIVDPTLDMVIAITQQTRDGQGQFNLLWDALERVEGTGGSDEALRDKCLRLAQPRPTAAPLSPRAAELNGSYALEDNRLRLYPMTFSVFTHKVPEGISHLTATVLTGETVLELVYGGRPYTLHISTDGLPRLSELNVAPDIPSQVYATGIWTAEDTFRFRCLFIEGPAASDWTLRLTGHGVELTAPSAPARPEAPTRPPVTVRSI